ncbi:glycosyl transferase, family 2 [Sulfuriferula multivorans]|uniref:Glycosyl transferase, family 2 n=1 Tax=Sulfuriferula multivorans TaxID=1559896 RepID=A0A401J9E2_9PROT|nr:glycosyltransferase family 2 protein [Sulfuriferula multivorans]GBL44288.1 glycosyl transferase, family 2 [Sulfuriferula multivorans]
MKKLISIVIPAYNEQDNVDELARRLQGVFAANPAYDFEAIIVENGSLDNTYEKLLAVHKQDNRFKVLQLARNFRMDGGLTAGLNYASGDAAVIMTADLQDPPELITEFIKKWEEGYENVYGIVTKRNGTNAIRRFNSQLFYKVANGLTGGMVPKNVSDFRLVDRKVYETINSIHERNRFLRGIFAWVGYKSIGIKHERAERFAGVSGAHTFKVIELALKGIFAHTYIPLKLITLTGLAVSVFSFILLAVIIIKAIIWGVPFAGFGTIMAVMLLMFGILFTMLGIVSEYVGLIYEEVKQRPNYIVSQTHGLTIEGGALKNGSPEK